MMKPQSIDPRTKLLIVLLISSLAVFIKDLGLLLLTLFLSIAVTLLLKANLMGVLKKIKTFLWVFIAIVVLQSIFTKDGTVILELFNIKFITDIGLTRGIQTILRFLIIIASAVIMTTSNSREIIQGLVQWKIPYELAFMVSVAIRFLPLIQEEVNDMMTAIQLRGVDIKRIPLMKRLKTYSYLLMPMITSVLLKSQELSVAMEMRAFRAFPQRTSYKNLELSKADYGYMLLSAIIFGIILLKYNGSI
ncbi:MAG: Energy-coupling factor transporter transmembrane protein EcfT [Syntrophomonadaceae bacterium]|nr:Energy-coupling factor transporter transmembrane protein EcfT [Bacillota bacterium]